MRCVSVVTYLVILAVGVTHLGVTTAGRLPKTGGRVNMQEGDGGQLKNTKPASSAKRQAKHLNRQGSVIENQLDDAAVKKAAKEAFNNWQKDQYNDWQDKQPSGNLGKEAQRSEKDNSNVEESQEKFQKLHKIRKSKNQQHEVLDDDEEKEKEKLEEEELSVLFPKVVEEEPKLVDIEKPARPVHKASKEEIEQQEEMKKHNKKWREQHPGRKQDKHKIDEWQRLQNEEMAKQRKQFEQDTFDEKDDDTDMKAKMADEAEELRLLEPHVETHNKAQKEEIKEHDAHKEEVIDLLNPEEVLHDGEKHAHEQTNDVDVEEAGQDGDDAHEDGEEEECEDCRKLREAEEQVEKELNAKLALEADELRALEPHVETHTKVEKKVDEILKNRPFSAGDIESAVHGGDHVHGEHDQEKAGPGDVEALVQGGGAKAKEEEHGEIGVEDPETLMHGEGGHHHGDPEGADIGLHVPEEVQAADGDFAHDDSVVKMKVKDNEKANIGLNIEDIEKVVHGDDPAHDEERVPGKKITMQDILKLGLSEEMLKGVDLTKIMEQDQKEYELWQNGDDDDDDDDDDDNAAGFWGQMSQIRKNYLDGLAARIRNIGVPDMENAEWDDGTLDDTEMPTGKKEAHPGESGLEHEMEMWANTAPKGEAKNLHGKGAPTSD